MSWTNNPTYAWEGTGSVMIRSNGTTATSPTISLLGYTQAEVKFYFTAVGMESNKSFTLRYSSNNGSTWSTVATFTSASTASGTRFVTNNGFYVATVTMNSTSFKSTTKFRIQSNGSNTTDIIYFDAVTIKGRTNTTGSGNVVTLAAVTKPLAGLQGLNGFMNSSESISTVNSDIILYPNPVADILNVSTREKINGVRIFTSNGSLVRTERNVSDSYSFDVSGLDKGVYFIEIRTDRGSVTKKIIKQ